MGVCRAEVTADAGEMIRERVDQLLERDPSILAARPLFRGWMALVAPQRGGRL
ncbi:MAG TPA: hypothetical protein VFZ70_13965 [Euzebyales bacterium]